jgi:AcrR family transcriptional regulator
MDYQVTMPFRGVSADDRRMDRRQRLMGSAYEIAGTQGAGALGVGRVCVAAGLTKRYFYESFASLAELQSAVVDHAIAVMSERVGPFRPTRPGGPPQAWLEAFVGALVDDECLARVLLTETHGGVLSPFRHQIIDVAIAGMAPPDSDPQADLRARLVACAQIGNLERTVPGMVRDSCPSSGRHLSTCWLICSSVSTALPLLRGEPFQADSF